MKPLQVGQPPGAAAVSMPTSGFTQHSLEKSEPRCQQATLSGKVLPAAGLPAPQPLRDCSPSICSVPPPCPPASDADATHWILGPTPPRMTSAELAHICKDVFPNKVTLTGTGLPWWLSSEDSACNAGDLGTIPGLGRSLGEGNSCPLQYSYWDNSMDTEARRATVHGVTESD